MNPQVGAANSKPPSSLMNDATALNERLIVVLQSLETLNDRLNGDQPRDASAKPAEVQPSARRLMDDALHTVSRIEEEIQRISARL